MNKTEQHKKAMLQALEKSLGNVTDACKQLQISRSTYYSWLKSDEEFKNEVEAIEEISIDFVESKLFELIDGVTIQGQEDTYKERPNVSATIFYLKTKGKKRGYVERQEIDGTFRVPSIDMNNWK